MIYDKFFKLCLFFCFLQQLILEAGPTQRHINLHSIETISENLKPKIQENIPLFLEIASDEDEETFFGYHAVSQNSRLFQDILDVVFKDVLNISIPNNFYFLRIPGEPLWNWSNGKQDFLNQFGIQFVCKRRKDLVIRNFLLVIEKELGYRFQVEDLSESEYAIFWSLFQDYIDYKTQNNWIKSAKSYSMPIDYKWEKPDFSKGLPSIVKVITEKASKLESPVNRDKIKQWFQNDLDDYTIAIIMQLRELHLENNQDAQFLDNLDLPFNDTLSPQNAILVSLNTSILANYVDRGCFTAGIFLKNRSVLGGDDHLEKILYDFFDKIGLEPSLANLLWHEGQKKLLEMNENHGCLLQFFDDSINQDQKAFSLVDQNTYVSFRHGVPVTDLIPSDYIQGLYMLKKNRKDLELRLVVNNKTTLNPFSTMRIIRYNGHFKQIETSTELTSFIKDSLKDVEMNQDKQQNYLRLLENIWNVPLNH